jgi:hypothetical protein
MGVAALVLRNPLRYFAEKRGWRQCWIAALCTVGPEDQGLAYLAAEAKTGCDRFKPTDPSRSREARYFWARIGGQRDSFEQFVTSGGTIAMFSDALKMS